MIVYLFKLFICFIIFSTLGWVLEVLYGVYKLKKIVNRGFLIGPLCPIYGVSCVLLYIILSPISNSILLFLLSALICSVVEYLVSFLLERLFKIRWWDYNNMRFNLNGRICLEMAIPFGLLGVLSVKYIIPFTLNMLNKLPVNNLYIITLILLTFFLADAIISFLLTLKFKRTNTQSNQKDNTIEVTAFKKNILKK